MNYNLLKIITNYFVVLIILHGLSLSAHGVEASEEDIYIQSRTTKLQLEVKTLKRSRSAIFSDSTEKLTPPEVPASPVTPNPVLMKRNKTGGTPSAELVAGFAHVETRVYEEESISIFTESASVVEDFEPEDEPKVDLWNEHATKLRGLGLKEDEITLILIANGFLHKDLPTPSTATTTGTSPILDQVSPEKLKVYRSHRGTDKRLIDGIQSMSTFRILNPSFGSTKAIYSPPAKLVMSRTQLMQARKDGVVNKLPPIAHVTPVTPETPEERQTRERNERMAFLETEKKRGKFEVDLENELKREREIFGDYLNYVKRRKAEIGAVEEIEDDEEVEEPNQGNALGSRSRLEFQDEEDDLRGTESSMARITKTELEKQFVDLVANKLTHLKVEGYDLYFSKETLDLERVQKNGLTNREVMRSLGKSPIGADGKPMNFHHLTHYDAKTHRTVSYIVLLTESIHQGFSGLWHFGQQTYRLPKKRVTRQLFNPAREAFNRALI